jgi:hypothetical protein
LGGWQSRVWQGRTLGSALPRDGVLQVVGAAETIGVRALVVHDGSLRRQEERNFWKI